MSIDFNNPYIHMQYSTLLECIYKNYDIPNKETMAYILVHSQPKHLTLKDISFKEHIWYLFQYECEIHNHFEKGSAYWESKFLELIDNNLLDKKKFLNEVLLTTTRFNNRSIPNYFFRILDNIKLSDKEILNSQENLFAVLQSQHSKPINQTIKYLKRIYKEPTFKLNDFMEQVPLLLSWDIKAVVNSTLGLLDVLMKAYPKQKEELALLVVHTLAQEDESLQTKAIKILSKHKLLETRSILDEINIYSEGLYHSSKLLLPTLDKVTVKEETINITPPQRIREDNRIPTYESFDELVFFFSQVFEQNNLYDFDLFLALLPKLRQLTTKNNVDKLEPAFQRAVKSYASQNAEVSSPSNIVPLMAVVFLEFAIYLKNKFTDTLLRIEKDYKEVMYFFSTYGTRTSWNAIMELEEAIGYPTEVTEMYIVNSKVKKDIKKRKSFGYIESTHAQLLLHILNSKFTFIPISTPTHKPCWIESETLINRIKYIQKNNIEINIYDMQIALSRVLLNFTKIDTSGLEKEFKDLFNYLFENKALNIKQVKKAEFWLVAVLRKNNHADAKIFTDTFSNENLNTTILSTPTWHAYREPWEYEDWEKGVKVKKSIMSPKFTLERKRIVENLPFESIFKHSSLNTFNISSYDCSNYLYLSPTIPKFLLQNIVVYSGKGYGDTYTNKMLESVSLYLVDIWDNFNEQEYMFLAYIMIYESKTTRTLASELWIKATSEGTMNHQLLGSTLGKLEHNEYAPLKRFTDLIVANMLNISTLHNKGLHTLLSNMIPHMNDDPIKGTKKLLEIYMEVLSLTKMEVPSETLVKLVVWGEVKTLRVIIKKLRGV